MFPKIINSFIYNVFDYPVADADISYFIKDNNLDVESIVMHNITKTNILFQALWKHCFGLHATKIDFYNAVLNAVGPNYKQIAPTHEFIDKTVTMMYAVKFGILPLVNAETLKQQINHTISLLTSQNYILNAIYEKWLHRYGLATLPHANNIFVLFTQLHARKKTCNPPSSYLNIISKNILEVDFNIPGDFAYETEYTQFIWTNDAHWLSRLMSSPCIMIYDNCMISNETIEHIIDARGSKQATIFWIDKMGKPLKPHRNYLITRDQVSLIPKVAPWCLCVCNESLESRSATIIPLAKDAKNTMLLYQGTSQIPDMQSVQSKFNRVFTKHATYPISSSQQHIYTYTYDSKDFWKAQATLTCPLKSSTHPYQNALLFHDFLQKYVAKRRVLTTLNDFKDIKKNCVVLLDNRENYQSVISMLITLSNVNQDDWCAILYTSEKSKEFYVKHLGNIVNIKVHTVFESSPVFDIDTYNDAMICKDMWLELMGLGIQKTLVIQDDGLILRRGVDRFLEYDYVGAPWKDTPERQKIKRHGYDLVGNGGLSIRSVQLMHDICAKHEKSKHKLFFFNINRIPEDVFFVLHLQDLKAKIASHNIATSFASEEILNTSSIGMHKTWMYHQVNDIKRFVDNILSDI